MTRTEKLIIAAVAIFAGPLCVIAAVSVLTIAVGDPTQSPTPTVNPIPTALPFSLPTPMTPLPDPDMGDNYSAIAVCKRFVGQRLVSPADAQWPGLFDEAPEVRQTGMTTWRVASWVDAPNAAGVHIRISYVCTVRYLGDDQWRLEVLDFQQPGEGAQAEPPTPAPTPTKANCIRRGATSIGDCP